MKNQITLSLITAAILGLNGCGGSSKSASSDNGIKLNSIQKLSEASTKHTKADWIAIETQIQALDDTDGFNTMLLDSTEKNVATLNYVGIDKEMAYATNSDAMFDDLNDLDIDDLDNQVLAECKEEDETCKEMAYDSLELSVLIDKEMAYAIATDIRKDEEKPSTMDGLLEKFTCDAGLVRKVQFYGVEDNFSTANGDESASASQQVQSNPGVIAYNNAIGLSNYDTTQVNRQFAEEVKNLPMNITKGMFYMGMDNHGSNDRLTIGNMDTNPNTLDIFGEEVLQLNTTFNWNKNGSVYSQSFGNIDLRDNTSLKDYVQNNNNFDVYVQDDTYVDFITVATCSKPDPIKEIEKIVNKFECSEKETMLKILGGEIDAFDPTADTPAANPSNSLITNNTYGNGTSDYDQTNVNKVLLDTLDLSQVLGPVTKAEFHIGYKSLGNPLTGNDTVHIGEYGVEHVGGRYLLYPNGTNSLTPTPWVPNNINTINGAEQLLSVNLANTTSGITTSLNMLDWIQGKSEFDIRVEDDTSVDFTQLNLCIKDNCDEGAKDISLDLSQLASWTNVPNDTQVGATATIWDNSMNWFNFTEEQGGERVLEIPFCACGNTIVNINSLKADNSATVKLVSTQQSTLIASQQASGHAAMRSDSTGGNHEDGSLTVAAGTNGGTNHVLRVDVKNQSLNFGVAIDGTLNFKGNLGECK